MGFWTTLAVQRNAMHPISSPLLRGCPSVSPPRPQIADKPGDVLHAGSRGSPPPHLALARGPSRRSRRLSDSLDGCQCQTSPTCSGCLYVFLCVCVLSVYCTVQYMSLKAGRGRREGRRGANEMVGKLGVYRVHARVDRLGVPCAWTVSAGSTAQKRDRDRTRRVADSFARGYNEPYTLLLHHGFLYCSSLSRRCRSAQSLGRTGSDSGRQLDHRPPCKKTEVGGSGIRQGERCCRLARLVHLALARIPPPHHRDLLLSLSLSFVTDTIQLLPAD